MKKILGLLMALIISVPMVANATTYSVEEDMTIDFDDSIWYVFTRDNIEDNSELDELGISYDYIYDLLNNNHMYIDAVVYYNDGSDFIEILVRKKENSEIKNFTNYTNDDLMDFAKELAKKTGAEEYSVYENDYKFAYSNYYDSSANYYVDEYYTIVNGYGYTITAQKLTEFDDAEKYFVRTIIDTITFDIDTSLKENTSNNSIITAIIIGAGVGIVIGGSAGLTNKIIKKKSKNNI